MNVPQPHLRPGEIHVWRVWLPSAAPAPPGLLAAGELERAGRFRSERDAQAYMRTRAALRRILSSYLRVEPNRLCLTSRAHVKPTLVWNADQKGLEFSVTHAEDLALIAVSAHEEIGVDVEKVQPFREIAAVARHFYPPRELKRLMDVPVQEQPYLFYKLWTRKEALFKAAGASSRKWLLVPFEPAPDYVATIATAVTTRMIVVRDLSPLQTCSAPRKPALSPRATAAA